MTTEPIQVGFDVFVHDGEKSFGAVRQVRPGRKPEIIVYVENAGDFVVPLSAVKSVESEKVVLNSALLDPALKQAIDRAHKGEDPRI
jgi:hypothetical protein